MSYKVEVTVLGTAWGRVDITCDAGLFMSYQGNAEHLKSGLATFLDVALTLACLSPAEGNDADAR